MNSPQFSSAEQQFLAEIKASPRQLDRRMIYADWLEERGDARAEFIHIWHEMESASLLPWSLKFEKLFRTRQTLRQEIDEEWLKQMGYFHQHSPMFTERPPNRDSLWRLLRLFVDLWHRTPATSELIPERILDSTEQRLAVKLPAAIREVYRHFGLMKIGNQLIDPADLQINSSRQFLCFWSWDAGGPHWGVSVADLGMDNPPISGYFNDDPTIPTARAASVVDFVASGVLSEVMSGESAAPAWRANVRNGMRFLPPMKESTLPFNQNAVPLLEATDLLATVHEFHLSFATLDPNLVEPIRRHLPPHSTQIRVNGKWHDVVDERRFIEGVSDLDVNDL